MTTIVNQDPVAVETTAVATVKKSRNLARKPLVTIDPVEYVAQVYQPFRDEIDAAVAKVANVTYDITTTAGMKTAVECRALFRGIRLDTDKTRKERKEPILEVGRLLDSSCKEIIALVAPHEEKYDVDIKAEEARKEAEKQEKIRLEQERVSNLVAKIEKITAVPMNLGKADSAALADALAHWEAFEVTEAEFEEFADQASDAVNILIMRLRDKHAEVRAAEMQAIQEAERRRLEAEEQARVKAELEKARQENERIQAEQRKQQEAAQAEQRRQQEELERERAEMRRQQEEQAAAMRRQQEEFDRERAAMRAREQAWLAEQARTTEEAKPAEPAAPTVEEPVHAVLEQSADLSDVVDATMPDRPDSQEMLQVLAAHYDVPVEMVLNWIIDMQIDLVADSLQLA